MTPDEHRMLVEVRDMVEENSRILKSIQRSNRASLALKIVYWVVILGASFGTYYLIQPYVNMLKGSLGDIQNDPSVVAEPFTFGGAVKNIQNIKNLYTE